VYLEAGSGALRTVPDDMIRAVAEGVDIPVIVGGGIRTPDDVRAKVNAGTSFVVIGNHLENSAGRADLKRFVEAAHGA
ncbi:MAG: geranylgeranylglyceryl/heptaprenylglyceryl phosphate synthase, partial [Candidatus Latescibacteria bacterium]|nr:geranylgeranylglyceryl/heptaprenylglyceryl phosphate synthase [Candidatus Latescibacterota bacterium]